MRLLRRLAASVLGLVLAAAAHAHDTWLVPPDDASGGLLTLALSSGNRFPKQETGLGMDSIVAAGCTDAAGTAVPLKPRRATPEALLLRVRPPRSAATLACWVRTQEFSVRIEPALVDVYLKEIQAPPAIVQAWQRQRADGVPWQEVYGKTARIELVRAGAPDAVAALRQPTGQGLELVPAGDALPRAGAPLAVRVLLDGAPLPGLAVEFVTERSPVGIWRTSDAEGQVRIPIPFGGRWMVRATHLMPPADTDAPWRSRFATLALELR